MRLTYFGGAAWDGGPLPVRGHNQEALLLRLAVDTGTVVGYRALAEDVWPEELPESPRAALQSLVSRLRRTLPPELIEATGTGYRLTLSRDDVDLCHFADLAQQAFDAEPAAAAALARAALRLWHGDPAVPDSFDWVVRDLVSDRGRLERLARGVLAPAPDTAPGTIPAATTSIVGRERELALIERQLDAERLVTLIGPGGAGKTTLALEAARARPGSIVVALAPAAAGEVWPAVAGAVGRSLRVDTGGTPTSVRDRALEALTGRAALLVLDNCEHVSAEAAQVALDLLGAAPTVRILATSREPLGVPGEAFVDLGPLPDDDAYTLFAARLRAARGAAPSPEERDAVDRIVRRLDGLPLALELAAAKARILTLAEIDAGLDDRFTLLAAGPRAADPRHQTLRALIDWSWETLTGPERVALLAAATFPDGVGASDLPTVAAHTGTDPQAFDALVDRSLLRRVRGRFRMLETVREYGLDRLRADGREQQVQTQRAAALAELARDQDPLLRGPRVREALAWFDANEENLTSAVRACREPGGSREIGIALLRAGAWAWMMRERFDEITLGLEAFAAAPPWDERDLATEPAVVVNGLALLVQAFLAVATADDTRQLTADEAERSAALLTAAARTSPSELAFVLGPLLSGIASQLRAQAAHASPTRIFGFAIPEPDDDVPAWTHAFLAILRTAFAQNTGDVDSLGRESERALAMFVEIGDVWGIALASQMRSEWLMLQGRLEDALEVADASTQALVGLTSVADLLQQQALAVGLLVRLGRIGQARTRIAEVRAAAEADGSERALLQYRFVAAELEIAVGDGEAALRLTEGDTDADVPGPADQIRAWTKALRARALLLLGRTEDARPLLREAAAAARHSGDQPIVAMTLVSLAWWLAEQDQHADARRALTAAAHARGAVDATDPVYQRVVALTGEPATRADEAEIDDLLTLLDRAPTPAKR